MKEIKTTTETLLFECSVCSKRHAYKEDAEGCDKRHIQEKCKHRSLEFNLSTDGRYINTAGDIQCVCKTCGAYLGVKSIRNSKQKEIDRLAKKLFFESTAPFEAGCKNYWDHITIPQFLLNKKEKKKYD